MAAQTLSREATDRYADVDGVRIHYNEAGSGPALLCFHGGGPGANAWDNSKHNLPALAEHFRVLLVDLPGFGQSDKSARLEGTPLDLYWARTMRGLLDGLGIERAHLYGSSQSGPACLRFGLEWPERVGKIVLQSSGPGRGNAFFTPTPPEGIKALGEFAENPTRENMTRMMRLFVPRSELLSDEMVEARYQAALVPGHLEARREFSAAKNTDLSEAAKRLQAEVLVVWGHQDRMVPLDGAFAALWQLPNVRLHVWGGGSGHFVEYEHADEFDRLVVDFLTGREVSAGAVTEAATSRFVDAGGVRLHYNEAGSGAPVVFLHGSGPGASSWSNFQRNVGPLAQRYRALLLDQPGYGKSDSVVMDEPRSVGNARAVRDFLDALGIERASLVGNSMGGTTALNFAIDYPERVDRIVCMGAPAGGQSWFVPMPTEGIKVLNEVFDNPTVEGMRRLIQLMVFDSSFMTDELLQERLSTAQNPAHIAARQKSSTAVRDLTRELAGVKAPTLIIHGRDDRVVPLDLSVRLLNGIPDARLHVFGKCGHWAQFEHAAAFNRLVLDFLG